MTLLHENQADTQDRLMQPFLRQQVDSSRPDGYWIESFPYKSDESIPHLIGYGLGTSEADSKIILYLNPYNTLTPRYHYPLVNQFIFVLVFYLLVSIIVVIAQPRRMPHGRKGKLLA
jgi:hypothetical protein